MPSTLPAFVQPHPDAGSGSLGGLWTIDTGFHRPNFDACYLLVDQGRAAFIDTGTTHAVPRLLAALDALGLAPEAVDWVIPTHVHLDHAGGVGRLVQQLPAARVLVHPRGARHLVDPTQLVAGATAVYGEAAMARDYGQVHPVPAERVVDSQDGMVLRLAGRELQLFDTPGHARHHHAIWDARSRTWFAGDTFGISYRELDQPQPGGHPPRRFLLPSSTPVQFEPAVLRASVQRMLALQPRWVCLTHYGPVDQVPDLGALFLHLLDEVEQLGVRVAGQPLPAAERHQALRSGLSALYRTTLQQRGHQQATEQIDEWLAMDVELNAQGMGIWLDHLAKA